MEFTLAPAPLEYRSFPGWPEFWAESEDPSRAGDPLIYKVSSIWSNLKVDSLVKTLVIGVPRITLSS